MEARLGFDPNEGPEAIIDRLMKLTKTAGPDGVFEIASSFSQEIPWTEEPQNICDIFNLNGHGLAARLNLADIKTEAISPGRGRPWTVAHRMAGQLRKKLAMNGSYFPTSKLAELFDFSEDKLKDRPADLKYISLGKTDEQDEDRIYLYLNHTHESGQRFYLARFLGDCLLNSERPGSWLAATFCSTWRQKFQRAFGAELLCPIEALKDFLQNNKTLQDGAEHFGMTIKAITNHWDVNQSRYLQKPYQAYEDDTL